MEPTPLWWGDIRSKREKARAKQPELFGFDEEDPGDNELLSANGKVGRDFLNLMAELTPVAEDEDFVSPAEKESGAATLLLEIQRDIFDLKSSPAKVKRSIAPTDRSLQIHSCHSVVRELEILHDYLLDLLQRDPALKPKDIIVMMPDVSIYAPFIDAVFGVPENPKHKFRTRLPIANRAPVAESSIPIFGSLKFCRGFHRRRSLFDSGSTGGAALFSDRSHRDGNDSPLGERLRDPVGDRRATSRPTWLARIRRKQLAARARPDAARLRAPTAEPGIVRWNFAVR